MNTTARKYFPACTNLLISSVAVLNQKPERTVACDRILISLSSFFERDLYCL
jgi:hypothetical protein